MKQIAALRVNQVAAKYGDQAPMAAACCNACRICVTTNIVGVATAAIGAAWVALRARGRHSS